MEPIGKFASSAGERKLMKHSFENTVGGDLYQFKQNPRLGHSSMECWNPDRHGCLRTNPASLDVDNPCQHDGDRHFHVLYVSVRS
jgi:hypothetical protein